MRLSVIGIQRVAATKIVTILDTNLHGLLHTMICQQVTLSGDAEWPKVADAVIEAHFSVKKIRQYKSPVFCNSVLLNITPR